MEPLIALAFMDLIAAMPYRPSTMSKEQYFRAALEIQGDGRRFFLIRQLEFNYGGSGAGPTEITVRVGCGPASAAESRYNVVPTFLGNRFWIRSHEQG